MTGANEATDVAVMSSMAFREALTALAPAFETAHDGRATAIWAGGKEIPKRILGGEIVDLVVTAAPAIDSLIAAGKLVVGSRTDLASCGIGVAVAAGALRPDIGSVEALKKALLAARSIAYSSGPSGVHMATLFARWGIAEALRPKTIEMPPGQPVGGLLAQGGAEIGFQQVSELLPVKGIDFIGPLPAQAQEITVFSAGLHVNAKAPRAARALLRFLRSPEAFEVIRQAGMEPA